MTDRRAVFSAALIVLATALLVLGGVYVVSRLRILLLWVILVAILATGLRPFVRRLERAGPPAGLSRVNAVLNRSRDRRAAPTRFAVLNMLYVLVASDRASIDGRHRSRELFFNVKG